MLSSAWWTFDCCRQVDENGESSDEDAEQPPLVNADARTSDGEEQQQQLSTGVSESAPLTVRVKVEPKSHTEGREQVPRKRIAMLWTKLRAIAYITSLEVRVVRIQNPKS